LAVSIKNFILHNPQKRISSFKFLQIPGDLNSPSGGMRGKKAGYSHRTAQPPTLAAFRPWEGSAGAGRVRPAGRKDKEAIVFDDCEIVMSWSRKIPMDTNPPGCL